MSKLWAIVTEMKGGSVFTSSYSCRQVRTTWKTSSHSSQLGKKVFTFSSAITAIFKDAAMLDTSITDCPLLSAFNSDTQFLPGDSRGHRVVESIPGNPIQCDFVVKRNEFFIVK